MGSRNEICVVMGQFSSSLWWWLHRHVIKWYRTMHTSSQWQLPGFDIVLLLHKMWPLGESGWRVYSDLSTFFATSWVSCYFKIKSLKKIASHISNFMLHFKEPKNRNCGKFIWVQLMQERTLSLTWRPANKYAYVLKIKSFMVSCTIFYSSFA